MEIVVGGVGFIISFFVAVSAFEYTEIYKAAENNEISAENNLKYKLSAIISIFNPPKVKILLKLMLYSLLNAVATYCILHSDMNSLYLAKSFLIGNILTAASIIDRYTKKIPNFLVAIFAVMRLVLFTFEFVYSNDSFKNILISSFAGLVVSFALFFTLSIITKGGLGMGDVKLIAALGFCLGVGATLSTILLGMIVCSVVSIILLLTKTKKIKDEIPFGPFIYAGYIAMVLLGC